MDTLNTLKDKVNEKLKSEGLVFIASDFERGLGLENLLENYHIVSTSKNHFYSALVRHNKNVFSVEEELVKETSSKIFGSPSVQSYIYKNNIKKIQTFKISKRFEEQVSESAMKLLNTTSEMNEMFEDKLSQYEMFKDSEVSTKKNFVSELGSLEYENIVKDLGDIFVIQYSKGHTGSGTVVIRSSEEFENEKQRFPNRKALLSEFIMTNLSYTVNGCITDDANYFGGLSYQITGVPDLTSSEGATVGNDFSVRTGINEEQVLQEFQKIGNIMQSKGYRGMFGIDFLIKNDEFYLIEVNARQTASVPFYTYLQLDLGQIPLSLIHLAQFLNIEFDIDEEEYNKINLEPIEASQIFIRAKDDYEIKGKVYSGFYRLQSDNTAMLLEKEGKKDYVIYLDEEKDRPLIFDSNGYNILEDKEKILVHTKEQGDQLGKGDEIARIQLMNSAMNEDLSVKNFYLDVLKAVKESLR